MFTSIKRFDFRNLSKKRLITFLSIGTLFVLFATILIVVKINGSESFLTNSKAAITSMQTISFDDKRANNSLDGQYPSGLIDWGKDVWIVNKPQGKFNTNNLQYSFNVKSASFKFVTPKTVVSIDAYNYGGSKSADVTLSCDHKFGITKEVKAEQVLKINTNWTQACSEITISTSIGWDFIFDNLVIASVNGNTPTPTTSPINTTAPSPTSTTTPVTNTVAPTIVNSTKPASTVSPTIKPTSAPAATTPPTTSGSWWKPTAASPIHWQWQIGTPFNTSTDILPNVSVYDIDGFDNSASVVSAIHASNSANKVICYISAGTYENWRTDAGQFPTGVLGSNVSGWAGEKWLDVRNINSTDVNSNGYKLAMVMKARMDMCKSKGFDAIEPDNVDGYSNSNGFSYSAQDQIAYNTWFTKEAHARGLSIGLKNDLDQVSSLVQNYDWALVEECYQYNECNLVSPFVNANKAVFATEYKSTSQCTNAKSLKLNSMTRDLNLVSPSSSGYKRTVCVADTQNSW